MKNPYDDIIGLSRPVSKNHPPMALLDRAAQFSPFAALTGHEEAIAETARLTQPEIELDESRKLVLNECLRELIQQPENTSEVSVTYFQRDRHKEGGAYLTVFGRIKKINEYEKMLLMEDGTKIPLEEIYDIHEADDR